jgi:hypothetical protein
MATEAQELVSLGQGWNVLQRLLNTSLAMVVRTTFPVAPHYYDAGRFQNIFSPEHYMLEILPPEFLRSVAVDTPSTWH